MSLLLKGLSPFLTIQRSMVFTSWYGKRLNRKYRLDAKLTQYMDVWVIVSLIPFELGLWNAWMLILPQIFIIIGSSVVLARRETYESNEEMAQHTRLERRVSTLTFYLIPFVTVYSIFLPLKLGTEWFYVGFPVYLLGTTFLIMANLAFTTTPVDKPVTQGVYRVSRHPMNVGFFLILIGTGMASGSWVLLLCSGMFVMLMRFWLPSEERWCLEQYGNAYRAYMNKTPRWIGRPKSTKNRVSKQ